MKDNVYVPLLQITSEEMEANLISMESLTGDEMVV